MKKLSLLLFFLFISISSIVAAYTKTINGIAYKIELGFNSLDAHVVYYSSSATENAKFYKGNILIESTITVGEVTYTVTEIEARAFAGCANLTSIKLPNTITSIGDDAFNGCSGLNSITIPNSVTSIGGGAFESCSGLNSITIPNSVTSIGNSTFEYCSGLNSVTIPNSVTSIGDYAFQYCRNLQTVYIGNSVSSISSNAFSTCSNLTSIVVDEENQTYDSRDNCNAIIRKSDNVLIKGCNTSFIPNGVTSIGDYAFCGSQVTSITIPNSVTVIGNWAFWESELTSIEIPNSVTRIGNYAFQKTQLTSIEIPNSVETIGMDAFLYSKLQFVVIGNSVTNIGYKAFGGNSIKEMVVKPNTPPTLENYAFDYSKDIKVRIPEYHSTNYLNKNWGNLFTLVPGHIMEEFEAVPATCTNNGNIAYWYCTDCYSYFADEEGTTEITEASTIIPASHIYGEPVWTWAANCQSASAKTVCSRDASHEIAGDAVVTSVVKIPATCVAMGTTTYTAKVTLNGIEYVDTKDAQDIPANGHSFTYVDKGNGTHQKTCSYGDVNDTEKHTIVNGICSLCNSVPVADLTVSETNVRIGLNEGTQLSCAIAPVNASQKDITWTSSNNSVVTVDDNGFVTPIALGSATVTAKTKDGTNLSATCVVTVYSNSRVLNDSESEFVNTEDIQYDELSYSRNFGTTNYQCLYVPMTIDVASVASNFDIYKIGALFMFDMNNNGVYFENDDETVLRIIKLNDGILLPNHPYFIKAKTTGAKVIPSYDNILYKAEENTIDCSTVEVMSTFKGHNKKGALGYEFFTLSAGQMQKMKSTAILGAYRWYVTLTDRFEQVLPTIPEARIRIDVVNDTEETGIEDVKAYDCKKAVLGIYSLDGKRLNRLESGINVIKYKDGSNVKLFIK